MLSRVNPLQSILLHGIARIMRIEVSDDVELPGPSMRGAIGSLKVNQSCFVETDKLRSVRVTASILASDTDKKFTVRKVEGGVRVWRIA